ncbi:MAG: hypothetical protein IJW18_03200 [Lachnospiraceae bacterium]|nr:hypothetical protein [Lachnospiraceae bacterium]
MKKRLLFTICTFALLVTGCNKKNININENPTTIEKNNLTDEVNDEKDNIYTLEEYYKTVIDFDIKQQDYKAFDDEHSRRNIDYYKDKINIDYNEMDYDTQYNVQFNTVSTEEGFIISFTPYNDEIIIITERINEESLQQGVAAYEREIWIHADDDYYKLEYEVSDSSNSIYSFVKTDSNYFIVEASKVDAEINNTWKIICVDRNNNSKIIDQASNYNSSTLLPWLSFSENKIIYLVGDEDKEGNVGHVIKVYDEKEGNLTDSIKVFNVMNPYLKPIIDNNLIYYMDYDELGWYIFKYDVYSKNIVKYHTGMKEVYEHIKQFSVSEENISYINSFNELYLYSMIDNDNKIIDRSVHSAAVSDEVCMYTKNGDIFTCRADDMVVRKLLDDDKYYFYYFERFNNKFIGVTTNKDTGFEQLYEIIHK